MADESGRTVTVALAANALITTVKFAAALLTGSAALLSEAAHSVSDTLNQGFLLVSLKRSARPADARHPFGYGKERFFWSLLAALGILVVGAGFSGIEAYRAFTHDEPVTSHYYLVAYVALVIAFAADGVSWLRALMQLRREARRARRTMAQHVMRSTDPSVKTVAGEDSAAVVGTVVAALGIVLHQVTGGNWWEGVAAAVVAVLLLVTGYLLARDVKAQLIGEAADPQLREEVGDFLRGHPAVDEVIELLTMQLGVDQVLLAVRLDLAPDLGSDDVESVSGAIDRAIQDRWPQVVNVFLDATRRNEPMTSHHDTRR